MQKRFQLIAKAALFTLLLPGVVTLLVPYLILGGSVIEFWPRFSIIVGVSHFILTMVPVETPNILMISNG